MINANKEKLANFFQGTLQLEVPFFQRSYVWDEENWITLWDQVADLLQSHENGQQHEHFIGTIITKQRESQKIGDQIHDLIDGQQRLTTVAIFLRAIHDSVSGEMPGLKDIILGHLGFKDANGKLHSRIRPSSYDSVYYDHVVMEVRRQPLAKEDHKIVRAYKFFHDKLSAMSDDRLELVRLMLLDRVPIINMLLSPNDDEQEIFDTINSLGVRLTIAELLKNFIFKDARLQDKYGLMWRDIYEDTDDRVEFWNTERTAGRIIRTNIEVLLYCYLIINTGKDVRLETLFKEYKKWLGGETVDEKLYFLNELRDYANIFYAFPSGSDLNTIRFDDHERRFFHVVENLAITTVLPLVLYIYKEVEEKSDRAKMLGMLESYLIRRNVCRFTTQKYNQLFIQVLNRLKDSRGDDGRISSSALRSILDGFDDDSTRVPSNEEFEMAFGSEILSNQYAREILFVLSLRQVASGLSDIPNLSLGNYTVEHIMPVKWEKNWTERSYNDQEKAERDRKLLTLGNLTLVTKRLNSKMQNAAWVDKRKHLKDYSTIPMTVRYLDCELWDEARIAERGNDLAKLALDVWGSVGKPSRIQA